MSLRKAQADLPAVLTLAAAMFLSVSLSIALLEKAPIVGRLENGIYSANVRSVLDDQDLNLINQVPPEQRWLVTRTYNFPDIRYSGVTALWLPFFAYGRLLPELEPVPRLGTPASQEDVATALATLVFTLTAIIFCFRILWTQLGKAYAWLSVILLSLGTPLLWYTVFEPYGTDLASMFTLAAGVFLYVSLLRRHTRGPWWWFLLGAFLAFGASVKVYGFFYLAIIAQVIFRWFSGRRDRQSTWELASVLSGAALVLSFDFANQYLKFGMVGSQHWGLQKYFAMFNPSIFLLSPFKLLLGPDGGLFVAPVYWLPVLGLGLWSAEQLKKGKTTLATALLSHEFALVAIPVSVFLATSFEMLDENMGTARRFMVQQFSCLFLLQYFLLRMKRLGKPQFRAALGAAVLAVAWHLAMTIRYAGYGEDFGNSYFIPFRAWTYCAGMVFGQVRDGLHALPSVLGSLLGWLPLILGCAWLLVRLWRACEGPGKDSEGGALKAALPFLVAPVALFALISVMNLTFNQRNVRKLQQENFFSSTVVGNGMDLFIYDDLASVLPKFWDLGKIRGNPLLMRDTELIRTRLLHDVAAQVLVDPIGFREDCEKDILRPSYFRVRRR